MVLPIVAGLLALVAAPSIPPEVQRCIDGKAMWVAAPDYFEALEIESGDGVKERAYQIRDHANGLVGHLLVMPARCRIVVLILDPKDPEQPLLSLSYPEGIKPSMSELRALLRWAGFRELPADPAAKVRPATRSMHRDGRYLWLASGRALESVDLESGAHRHLQLPAGASKPGCAYLVHEGLAMPCAQSAKVMSWSSLRGWLGWETAPNGLFQGDDDEPR